MRRHPSMLSRPTPHPVIAPTGEIGWLTPVRATWGCAKTWIWTCRCGATVTREARSVRKTEREGRTAKCTPKCTGEKQPQQQEQP